MSHIPASRMPHAHAHDDQIDGEPKQPDQAQPAPDPTTAVPPASASGASPMAGDKSADDDRTPTSTSGDGASPALNDASATHAGNGAPRTSVNGPSARDDDDRSPLALAAMVIGSLAVVGGLIAALTPLLVARDEPKSKKRKKRKTA